MASRKTEFSKDPKDVKYGQKSNKCCKQDQIILSKKANIPKLLKSLFYRIGTSNVYRCISILSNTHSTNHSAPIHSKTQPSIRTDNGGFYICCASKEHIHKYLKKKEKCMKCILVHSATVHH